MSYLEYWGLKKNPFDSVPDPGMYFSSHSTVENTVAELLFAIEEGNECLAVVVGQVGLGKTMALRVVLDSLDAEKYSIAFITNPDLTFIQILREIVGQLSGEKCTTRAKDTLLEEFNRILFETADSGRKVLVFIDEGNAMRPRNLEKLRLLTNMQEDTRNLLTLIIAGQPKLGRMLHHPDRANLFQRIGVYAQLEPLASARVVRDYIEHRLERAGRYEPIFEESAFQAIHDHSGGVPRLINRVSKLALKAGETNEFSSIDGEIIKAIASRFESPAASPKSSPSPAPAPREKESAKSKESRPAEPEEKPAAPAAAPTEKLNTENAEAGKSRTVPAETSSQNETAYESEKPRPPAAEAEKPRAAAVEPEKSRPAVTEVEKPRAAAAGTDQTQPDASRDRKEEDRSVVRTQQEPPRTPAKESRPPADKPGSLPASRPDSHEIHISAQHSRPTLNGRSDHRLSSYLNREGFGARPENPAARPPVPDSSRKSEEAMEARKQPADSKVFSRDPRRSEQARPEPRLSDLTAPKPAPRPASEESGPKATPSPSSTPSARPQSGTPESSLSAARPAEGRAKNETKPPEAPLRPAPSWEREKPRNGHSERSGATDSTLDASAPEKRETAVPQKDSRPAPQQPSREEARTEAAAKAGQPEPTLKGTPIEPRRFQAQPQQPGGSETSDAEKWDVAKDVLEQLRQISDSKDRLRLAGQMAAREISEHPEKYREAHTDPVRIWDELRTQIMRMAL